MRFTKHVIFALVLLLGAAFVVDAQRYTPSRSSSPGGTFTGSLFFSPDGTLTIGSDAGGAGARPANIYASATVSGNTVVQTGNAGKFLFHDQGGTSRSELRSSADGIIELFNTAETGFTRLNFGGTTSSFPALMVSSANLLVKLADNSGFTTLDADVMLGETGVRNRAAGLTDSGATGVSVPVPGNVVQQLYKVTVDRTAFVCAAVTCDVTVVTLPAKTLVSHVLGDLTTVFACSATCTTGTLSAVLGKTAGGTQYLVSFDADAATSQFGDAAAELGASLAPATAPTEAGDLASWTATTNVVMRMTSGTGNIGTGAATNFSTGSVTFYFTTTRMP